MADHHLPADATCNMFTLVFQVLAVIIDNRVQPSKDLQIFLAYKVSLFFRSYFENFLKKTSCVSTFRYEILIGEVNVSKKEIHF